MRVLCGFFNFPTRIIPGHHNCHVTEIISEPRLLLPYFLCYSSSIQGGVVLALCNFGLMNGEWMRMNSSRGYTSNFHLLCALNSTTIHLLWYLASSTLSLPPSLSLQRARTRRPRGLNVARPLNCQHDTLFVNTSNFFEVRKSVHIMTYSVSRRDILWW